MSKYKFTKKDVGAAVVFAGFDGGRYSATVIEVSRGVVRIKYFPHPPLRNRAGGQVFTPAYATLVREEWKRLTLFAPGSKFLVLTTN